MAQTVDTDHNQPDVARGLDVKAVGRRVLALEADGLNALAASLDDKFIAAVDLIFKITGGANHKPSDGASPSGRVVVTGIGKSGHIGRKMAATFASTGTPSMFVHPAEAVHGDLGMITRHDVVLAISYSGRMAELAALGPYAKRFRIPMIGITRDLLSPLGEQSDIALILPCVDEACPLHLAPTTSTTMTLALGDALAMALLEKRGFSADEFRIFHPGGALGQKLLRVHDLMHDGSSLPLVRTDTSMGDTLLCISEKSFGCAGVVNAEGHLLGIVTDGDLRRHMSPDLLSRPTGDIMTKSPKTIRPNALAAEAVAIMNEKSITSLFVVEDKRPVGLIHIHDLLRAGVA